MKVTLWLIKMDKRSTVLFWAIYCFLIAYADEQSDVCEDFGCDQQCEVIEGEAICTCYKGFQLDNDGKTCSGIIAFFTNMGTHERSKEDNSRKTYIMGGGAKKFSKI